MLLRPGALALLALSLVSALLLASALPHALRILRRWNPADPGEGQVALERGTWLFPPLVALAVALQALDLPILVQDTDRAAELLPGAMCAVGTFRAAPQGFPALLAHLGLVLLGFAWLALHRVDVGTPGGPLAKVLAAGLLVLAPLQGVVLGLQAAFYGGLEPGGLTSCCQALFDPGAASLPGELAAWSPRLALPVTGTALALAAALAFAGLRAERLRPLAALAGLGASAAGAAALVSVLGPYVYELPGHHCPFCLLRPEHGRVGWLLHPVLLAGAAASLAQLALVPLRGRDVAPAKAAVGRRLAGTAGLAFLALLLVSAFLIGRSRLILL